MYSFHSFLGWYSDDFYGFRKLDELSDLSRIDLDISILATRANALRRFPGHGSVRTYLSLDVLEGVDRYHMPSLPLSSVPLPVVVLWPRWVPKNRWNLVMSFMWLQRMSIKTNVGQDGYLGRVRAQRCIDRNERTCFRSLPGLYARVCPKSWDSGSLGLFKRRLCRSTFTKLNRWKINITLITYPNLKWWSWKEFDICLNVE